MFMKRCNDIFAGTEDNITRHTNYFHEKTQRFWCHNCVKRKMILIMKVRIQNMHLKFLKLYNKIIFAEILYIFLFSIYSENGLSTKMEGKIVNIEIT